MASGASEERMRRESIAFLKDVMVPLGILTLVFGIVLAILPVCWELWQGVSLGNPNTPDISLLVGIGGCLGILGATAVLAVT
jgi:hypothetical protein